MQPRAEADSQRESCQGIQGKSKSSRHRQGQKSKLSSCSPADEENQLHFTASTMEKMRLYLQGKIIGAGSQLGFQWCSPWWLVADIRDQSFLGTQTTSTAINCTQSIVAQLGPVRPSFKFSNSCHSQRNWAGIGLGVQHQQPWRRLSGTAGPLAPEHKLRAGEGVQVLGLF